MHSQQQDSHFVNLGKNGCLDVEFGEMGVDLGAFVPFYRYAETDHTWNQPPYSCVNLQALMYEYVTDLPQLDAQLQFNTTNNAGIDIDVQDELDSSDDHKRGTWWSDGDEEYVQAWIYTINGGHVLVTRRNVDPELLGRDTHVIISFLAQHDSDMSRAEDNRNGFDRTKSGFFLKNRTSWIWQEDALGNKMLDTNQQAIDAGDIAVWVIENLNTDLWTTLLRAQEVDWFLRNQFPAILKSHWQNNTTEITVGNTAIDGGSWGGFVSGILTQLQPSVYSASAGSFINDVGFTLLGIGDWSLLQRSHYTGAVGGDRPETVIGNRYLQGWPLLIDLLGIRFDALPGGPTGWDLGAFSITHRLPTEFQVLLHRAFIGSEDMILNWHWQRDDRDNRTGYDVQYLRNYAHAPRMGVLQGFNEVHHATGTEWFEIRNQWSTASGPNPPLVPSISTNPPPRDPTVTPYPTPYGHTLRHEPETTPTPVALLTEKDINPDTNKVLSLGQGTWPGYLDSMGARDLDGDGITELYFGNLEGYFHVLELNDPGGVPPTLVDEWKSPPLGWGAWNTAVLPATGQIRVSDHVGRISTVTSSGVDQYSLGFHADHAQDGIYNGPINAMYVGDFRNNGSAETLVLNQHLDWVLIDGQGVRQSILPRDTEAAIPGACAVYDWDGVNGEDLIVPAMDGHLWRVFWNGTELDEREILPFSDRSLYRVEVEEIAGLDYLLIFGRNDTFSSPSSKEKLRVYEVGGSVDVELDLDVDLRHSAYTKIGSTDLAVIGGSNKVQVLDLAQLLVCPAEIVVDSDRAPSVITSLVWVPGGIYGYLGVMTGSGRLYLFDVSTGGVTETRNGTDLIALPPAVTDDPPWYANQSLAHVSAIDVREDDETQTDRSVLYAADYTQPVWEVDGVKEHRILEVVVKPGKTVKKAHLTEVVGEVESRTYPEGHHHVHRAFLMEDLDGDSQLEPYVQSAVGVFMEDENGDFRQFCNRRGPDGVFEDFQMLGYGGWIWEYVENPGNLEFGHDYYRLGGFSVPADSTFGSYMWEQGTEFPREGIRPGGASTGQIAATEQDRNLEFYDGSAMVVAELIDSSDPQNPVKPHIVASTLGGYVYAILPGEVSLRDPASGPDPNLPASLSYASDCLGLRAIGLDAGKIVRSGPLEDPYDTVVVGTWLDTATFEDWKACQPGFSGCDPAKHRGQLLVLEADPATGRFSVADTLNGDDLLGPGGGLTSGVFGVKLDDIDGDGISEIWCGDASGHLYVFRHRPFPMQGWDCVYRSQHYAAYPGMYGNIFPIKNAQGETVELIVKSPGYLMRFAVDPSQL